MNQSCLVMFDELETLETFLFPKPGSFELHHKKTHFCIQVYLFITRCLGSIKLDRVISETRYSDSGKGGYELKLD